MSDDGMMFGVRLEPERLHPEDSLLRIPKDFIEIGPDNTGNLIQALHREVTDPVH